MHNAHGKKPLYEVIREAQAKSKQDKPLQPLRSEPAPAAAPPSPPPAKPVAPPGPIVESPQFVTRWPTKPRFFQFNADRIELSLPYQFAIALALSAIVLMLVIFRLGQHSPIQKIANSASPAAGKSMPPARTAASKSVVIVAPKTTSKQINSVVVTENQTPQTTSKGTNRIVIQTNQHSKDLEPVKDFFAANGIETEIRKIGGWYYLVTKEKFENPEKAGTDGFAARQRIIELGAKYQAPPGYGSFGTKPFSDAYGMRLDD